VVVPADCLKARRGGVETGRLGSEGAVVGIGAAHDLRERDQPGIVEVVAVEEGVE
jgi:hypothetical protein